MSLFVVQANSRDDVGLDRASFIPDGFSWPAFVLGQLWLLYRGLWLGLAVWIGVEVAYIALIYPHVPGVVSVMLDGLAHLFVGFEGNGLRQRKRARSAVLTDLVEARNRDEAEVIFYRRQVATPKVSAEAEA